MCDIIRNAMGMGLKKIIITALAAVFSITVLTGPVFATVENPNNPSTDTTQTTDATNDTTDKTTAEEEQPTCYDQVGGIGWLICPGTSFLANVIDGAYQILQNLLQVDPIPTDSNAPVHVVWEYLRNITNLIFTIILLIIIYSQLTGLGINNYGIKKLLPRIIITAILVNLSYIVCTLAVDVSNIIGSSLRGVFTTIENNAIANGTVSQAASTTSVAGIVATILGVGTVGTVVGLSVAGGITGLLWLLIPIVLSGAIAVISAVVTMAARQALIILLVMISPIAIVAYTLPNTEKWFQKWYKLFMSMLVFYPMFSILYGASQLAGLVMVTSAANWLGVILGIAIQILPLFLSIPLMRMSGTVLAGIDGAIHKATTPVQRAAGSRATEGRMMAKQRQLASNSNLPHNHLARWLEQRKVNRQFDAADMAATNKDSYTTRAMTSMTRNGVRKRGLTYYNNQLTKMRNQIDRTNFDTDMDDGFADDGTDARIRSRDLTRVKAINTGYSAAIIASQVATSRAQSVKMSNLERKADRIRKDAEDVNSDIHKQITEAFRYDNNPLDAAGQQNVKKAVNAVLADAITAKHKVDSEAKSNYLELYGEMPPGPEVSLKLVESIHNNDYNSMTAATSVMAARGDYDVIEEVLGAESDKLANDPAMQKQLSEALIKMKADDATLWSWAKSNMMRSAMHAKGKQIASYNDLQSYKQGQTMDGDIDAGAISNTSYLHLMEGIADPTICRSQDRTVYKAILKSLEDGVIPMQVNPTTGETTMPIGFSMKQLRSAATSGTIDGEKLDAMNALIAGGFKKGSATQSAFFNSNRALIEKNIMNYFNGMSASQLGSSKSATITTFNEALMAMHPEQTITNANGIQINSQIFNAMENQRAALNKPSATTQRSAMNPEIRRMFEIRLD